MGQTRGAVLFGLAVLVLPSNVRPQDKPIRADDLPREFQGTYQRPGIDNAYEVTLQIDKVEQTGETIRFSGTLRYMPGDYRARVDGTIGAKTRRITFRESLPSHPGMDTSGSFDGTISADRQTIEAAWTSKVPNNDGDLKLQRKKAKQP